MDALSILYHFYPEDTPLRRLLLEHSIQVQQKALSILHSPFCAGKNLSEQIVSAGALLHDIGIAFCHAPGILCEGKSDYLCHGMIGGDLLRRYGRECGENLEVFARICERHTGSGLTAEEIRTQNLPLPERDFLPETGEEKLICLADKFYSKSGDRQEKRPEKVWKSMRKFGPAVLARYEALCREFGLDPRPEER